MYPEGRLWRFKPPVESSICVSIVYAQKYCPSSAPVFDIQQFAGKRKNVYSIFHILLQFIGFAPGPNVGTSALQTPWLHPF